MTSLNNSEPKSHIFSKKSAMTFVIFLGLVSLFTDMTYEGARSITGQYLAILSASALTVGFVSGFGELIGYGLRVVSGYLADKTQRYWTIIFIGYFMNLLAIPLLALVGYWQIAAILIVLERVGKAIRAPARDAMLSQAAHQVGVGWGFGLHQAMDQTGAMLGPLLIALMLYLKEGYRFSFALLMIPAVIALILLLAAYWLYRNPQDLTVKKITFKDEGFQPSFWWYLAGTILIGAGYADFPLMAYHFQKSSVLSVVWIPLTYAMAMGINIVLAPLLGRWYDRKGFIIIIVVTFISAFFAPLAFLGNAPIAIMGVILWGIGMSAQESLMRAILANMVPEEKRGSAYGIFNAGYGIFWFLGSVLMGFLYGYSIDMLVVFAMAMQFLSIPLLFKVKKRLAA